MDDDLSTHLNVLPGDMSGIDQFEQRVPDAFNNARAEGEAFFKQTTSLQKELAKIAKANAPTNLAKEYAKIAAETGDVRKTLILLQTELRKMDASDADIKKAAQVFDSEYTRSVNQAAAATERAAATAEKSAQRQRSAAEDAGRDIFEAYDDAYTKANQRASAFGDVDTGLGGIRGVVDLVAPNAGQAVAAIQDVFASLEGVARLGPALKIVTGGLGATSAAMGTQTAASQTLAGAATQAAAGETAAAGGFGALLAALAPVVIVAAAIAGALALFSRAMDEGTKKAEAAAASELALAQARVEASQLIAAGDTEAVKARLDEANARKEQIEAARNSILALRDEAQARYDADAARSPLLALDERGEIDSYNTKLAEQDKLLAEVEIEIGAFSEAVVSTGYAAEESRQALEDAAARQAGIFREITALSTSDITTEQVTQKIAELNAAYAAEQQIQQQLIDMGLEQTAAFQESLDKQSDAKAGLDVYNSSIVQNAAAANDAAAAQQEFSEVMSAFAAETQQLNFNEALTALRASRDEARNEARAEITLNQQLQQQRQQHYDKLADIEQRGLDQIEQLRDELAEGTDRAAAEIAATQLEAQQQELAEASAFQKERLRATQDFEREKARIERDARESQFADILNNDVTALILSRRKTATQLGDAQEDFNVEDARATEDFTAEQEADRAATAEKIANIQTELTAYQSATQAKILATQLATEQQKLQEQQAFENRMAADQAQRDQESAWREDDKRIREQDRAEDATLAEAARQKRLADDLAAIDSVEAKQAAANASTLAGLEALELVALRIKGAAESIVVPVGTAVGAALGSGGFSGTAFANEGFVTRPTYGVFGESLQPGQAEAIVKFDKSKGLVPDLLDRTGGGAGASISAPITIENVNVGELVGPDEARAIATEIGLEVQERVITAVETGIAVGQSGG